MWSREAKIFFSALSAIAIGAGCAIYAGESRRNQTEIDALTCQQAILAQVLTSPTYYSDAEVKLNGVLGNMSVSEIPFYNLAPNNENCHVLTTMKLSDIKDSEHDYYLLDFQNLHPDDKPDQFNLNDLALANPTFWPTVPTMDTRHVEILRSWQNEGIVVQTNNGPIFVRPEANQFLLITQKDGTLALDNYDGKVGNTDIPTLVGFTNTIKEKIKEELGSVPTLERQTQAPVIQNGLDANTIAIIQENQPHLADPTPVAPPTSESNQEAAVVEQPQQYIETVEDILQANGLYFSTVTAVHNIQLFGNYTDFPITVKRFQSIGCIDIAVAKEEMRTPDEEKLRFIIDQINKVESSDAKIRFHNLIPNSVKIPTCSTNIKLSSLDDRGTNTITSNILFGYEEAGKINIITYMPIADPANDDNPITYEIYKFTLDKKNLNQFYVLATDVDGNPIPEVSLQLNEILDSAIRHKFSDKRHKIYAIPANLVQSIRNQRINTVAEIETKAVAASKAVEFVPGWIVNEKGDLIPANIPTGMAITAGNYDGNQSNNNDGDIISLAPNMYGQSPSLLLGLVDQKNINPNSATAFLSQVDSIFPNGRPSSVTIVLPMESTYTVPFDLEFSQEKTSIQDLTHATDSGVAFIHTGSTQSVSGQITSSKFVYANPSPEYTLAMRKRKLKEAQNAMV